MRTRFWGFMLAAGLIAGACGLSTQDQAQPITSVPFSLLVSTTSTPEPSPDDPAFLLSLFWISEADQNLIATARPLDDPPSVQDALDALVGGPSESELLTFPEARSPGSVSETLGPVAQAVDDAGNLVIQVADGAELRTDNRLSAAVIVCTVTQFSLVTSVEIQDADGIIPLSGLNSESIEGPATRSDFNNCEPPSIDS